MSLSQVSQSIANLAADFLLVHLDGHVGHLGHGPSELRRQLGFRSVVIQPGHGAESLRRDVVVLAGNIPLFCEVTARPVPVAACAADVAPGGAMIAGFLLDRDYELAGYDAARKGLGMRLEHR